MKARLLKAAKIRELRKRVGENLDAYRSGNFDVLSDDPSNFIETELDIDKAVLSTIDCEEDDHREVACCMAAYQALADISNYLARDERLWVGLCHTDLLDYSRKRWPIPRQTDKAIAHIESHFFVVGARGFERDNAVSRLWWMAALCKRVKKLSLEEALTSLLYQYDVRANIIERPTTSQSTKVFSAVLKKLDSSYNGDKKLFERERFRSIMKELNVRGGVRLLNALSEKEIQSVLEECVSAVTTAKPTAKAKTVVKAKLDAKGKPKAADEPVAAA